MRFTVSPEQLKFFRSKGYLELESLITAEEVSALLGAIEELKSKSPGYPLENLYRSIPLVSQLAKKKGWGQIASELIDKRPLRIEFDKFFSSTPVFAHGPDEDACGMVLNLESQKGIFFQHTPLPSELYSVNKACYLLLVMTAKYLPSKLNPLIIR